MAETEMTIEDVTGGYGQHILTIGRPGPEWDGITGCVILTDGELGQLAELIKLRRDGQAMGAATVTIRFTDTTGRLA